MMHRKASEDDLIQKILKQSTAYEKADFLPVVFGPFESEAVNGTLPVVLYGAGSAVKEY